MDSMLTGRCLCGAIHYRCAPPLEAATLCHCESCRRAAGAHAVGWLTVAAPTLIYGATAPREFTSSPGVIRAFCARCGTPLSYRSELRPGQIDVTLASLDEPGRVPPADHIWMQDALAWDRPGDGLPQYAGTRP